MRSARQGGGECWLDASSFIAFQRPLQHPLAACAQSYIPVRVACWKCDSVSLPGWQLEVLVPPAGVQKINVCFTCASLCSHELDTILSNTVPLVWAESLWIAGKCWPKVAGFFANQAGTRLPAQSRHRYFAVFACTICSLFTMCIVLPCFELVCVCAFFRACLSILTTLLFCFSVFF